MIEGMKMVLKKTSLVTVEIWSGIPNVQLNN